MTGIGLKIKELRMERDLTMEMLVADMNAKYELDKPINKSMVSRWENGDNDPSLENAKYLSMYFDVSLDYLIGNSDIRTPSRLLAYAKKVKGGEV
jgi:transcriptional regulator with XRE-family HTH domain